MENIISGALFTTSASLVDSVDRKFSLCTLSVYIICYLYYYFCSRVTNETNKRMCM